MNKTKRNIPYVIALLCAGFACTQDVFLDVVNWLSSLSMKMNYGWFMVLVFVLLSVWCGYQIKVRWRRFNYSDTFAATLLFFVITILYYRFVSEDYEFVPIVGNITYVDILWLLALAFIVEAIVNKLSRKPTNEEVESSILLDLPIETPKEDKFDYYSEARHIANSLSQLPKNKAVSVAVLSPWGNGKTSFVNLIKYAIEHGNNNKPLFNNVIIEFNPRQSKNIASIQEDFFKALTDAFSNESQIKEKIGDYLETIGLQDIHPLAKVFTKVLKETKADATKEVNEALDNLNKRLIVFIDDFDRLTDVEIIEVLKLIDKNAAFRNTIFITAYDEAAVSNALTKYQTAKDIAYIDKFFTLRFHLPLRSDVSVINELYYLLLNHVDGDIELLAIMNRRFNIIAECIKNLRDVKNFFNMFQMDYVFNTKHEINFEEYFLLELMKFKYYDDYCNLFKRVYINNQSLFLNQNADAVYTLRKEYSVDDQGNEPKGKQPRSINILRSIFANHKSLNAHVSSTEKPPYRSVQYIKYFEMYFTNRVYGHVQAEQLESLFSMQTDDEIRDFYNQCIQQKSQGDIVDFLRYQEWQDIKPKGSLTKKETFKKFVRLVFLYSVITNDNDTYMHALQLQLLYKPNFEKGYNDMDEQSYHDYLLDIIYRHDNTEHVPLAFLLRITHSLIKPAEDSVEESDTYLLSSDEVKQQNLDLFKKYISTQQQYTDKLSLFYRLCIDHVENNRLIIMNEANDIMREFLYRDNSNEYLNGFLVFNENDRFITIAFKDPFFKQIFPLNGEGDSFEKYVKAVLPEGNENRTEMLAYLERYRKAGSDHTGCYYVKNDNSNPSNMEIIKGLEF